MSKRNYYLDRNDKVNQSWEELDEPQIESPWADVEPAPADPVFGLIHLFHDDPNPQKVLLGVGIYKDEDN